MNRFSAVVIIVLLAVIGFLAWMLMQKPASQPAQGSTSTPVVVTEPNPTPTTGKPPLSSKVKVTSPLPKATVARTFTVTGEAPGPWYFEASFPVQVRNPDGELLASTPAQAQGDWMTEAQVLFKATLTVYDYSGPATLILLKDNPSGMPENDDSVSFPIVIK